VDQLSRFFFLLLLFLGHCYFFTCQLFEYHFINEQKTWKEAQAYCRINHTDLATVSNMTDMKRLLKNSTSTNNQNRAWIGLYNQTGDRTWHWSLPGLEMNKTEIKHWNQAFTDDDTETCAMTLLNQDGTWDSDDCNKRNPFFCYDVLKHITLNFKPLYSLITYSTFI
uniref:C-type lectin domain-containing protein n=1 Tax=Mastacembelus armatus TaxID=205130 RepID=A0A7N8YRK5_9TELE